MADDERIMGKAGDTIRRWFQTFVLILRNRRALLSTAPRGRNPPLGPVAFLFGGAAVAYVIQSIATPKAPDLELPPVATVAHQMLIALGSPVTTLVVAGSVISAAGVWLTFRLFRLPLSWRVALRHAAYNSGVQCLLMVFLAAPMLVIRLTARQADWRLWATATLGWFVCYVAIAVWMLRQYADECGVRVWRALPPFLAAVVPLWALAAAIADAVPETWLANIYHMAPAIAPDDPMHVNRWVLKGRDPRPGEVVTLFDLDEGVHWLPAGGAFRNALVPTSARVIAGPGDTVAAEAGGFIANGEPVPREPVRPRPHDPRDGTRRYRERLDGQTAVVTYGPVGAPLPCLQQTPIELRADHFLLAFDERPDGAAFCAIFPRAALAGLLDWNLRTNAKP